LIFSEDSLKICHSRSLPSLSNINNNNNQHGIVCYSIALRGLIQHGVSLGTSAPQERQ
jgi:hypothetical protein